MYHIPDMPGNNGQSPICSHVFHNGVIMPAISYYYTENKVITCSIITRLLGIRLFPIYCLTKSPEVIFSSELSLHWKEKKKRR